MTYSATFTRTKTSVAPLAGTTGGIVRVVYTVTGVTDFTDAGLFVFVRDSANNNLIFSHVAHPGELVSLALNTVSQQGWTRRNTVTLDYSTDSLAVGGIAEVDRAIYELVDSMNSLAQLASVNITYP
jgi:hypothetical protein